MDLDSVDPYYPIYLDSADVALLFRIMGDVGFVKSALDTVKGMAMGKGEKYLALRLGASPQSSIILSLVSFGVAYLDSLASNLNRMALQLAYDSSSTGSVYIQFVNFYDSNLGKYKVIKTYYPWNDTEYWVYVPNGYKPAFSAEISKDDF